MKTNKKRIAVSILTVFMMVFTVIPYMGYSEVSAATNNTKTITTEEFANPNTAETYTINVTKGQQIDLEWNWATGYTMGSPYLTLIDPNGNAVVGPTPDDINYKFKSAGKYTLEVKSSGWIKCKFVIKYTLKTAYVPTNAYKTCTMTKSKGDTVNSHYVTVTAKDLDYRDPESASTFEEIDVLQSPVYFYRICGNNVTLFEIKDGSGNTDYVISATDYPKLDKTYSYYVLKECVKKKKFKTSELPSKEDGKLTLTSSAMATVKEKLAKYGTQAVTTGGAKTIKMPKPVVAPVKNLKLYIYKDVVKSRKLMWDKGAGGVTGYRVKRYDNNGAVKYNSGAVKMGPPNDISKAKEYYVPYSSDPDKKTAYFTVQPYYVYNGKTYWGTESDKLATKSSRLQPPGGSITKINSSKAVITVFKATGAKGTDIYQNKNGKWVCIKKNFTGKTYTVTGTNAGNRSYKFKSYLVDNGTEFRSDEYSKSFKPMDNIAGWGSPKRASAYKSYTHLFQPEQLKSANGKVTLQGFFVNTHIYDFSMTVTATVKVDGKKLGSATFSSGRIGANSCSKSFTKKIKTGLTDKDLRQADVSVTYTTTKTKIY